MNLGDFLHTLMPKDIRPDRFEAAAQVVLEESRPATTLRFYITTEPPLFGQDFMDWTGASYLNDTDFYMRSVRRRINVPDLIGRIRDFSKELLSAGFGKVSIFPDTEIDGILRLNDLDRYRHGLFGTQEDRHAYYIVSEEFVRELDARIRQFNAVQRSSA